MTLLLSQKAKGATRAAPFCSHVIEERAWAGPAVRYKLLILEELRFDDFCHASWPWLYRRSTATVTWLGVPRTAIALSVKQVNSRRAFVVARTEQEMEFETSPILLITVAILLKFFSLLDGRQREGPVLNRRGASENVGARPQIRSCKRTLTVSPSCLPRRLRRSALTGSL